MPSQANIVLQLVNSAQVVCRVTFVIEVELLLLLYTALNLCGLNPLLINGYYQRQTFYLSGAGPLL